MPRLTYTNTVATKHREYLGRPLLLTNSDGTSLQTDERGELFTFRFARITHTLCDQDGKEYSLAALGKRFFGDSDPTVARMLRRLVTPEMELERVFNAFRYKYVLLIRERQPFDRNDNTKASEWMRERMSANYNNLFKILTGARPRGYSAAEMNGCLKGNRFRSGFMRSFENEKEDLDRILRLFRSRAKEDGYGKTTRDAYREVIAIKPGFHEIWMDLASPDADYHRLALQESFSAKRKKNVEDYRDRRSRVLALFHGLAGRPISWRTEYFSREINIKSFRTYAACAVTEGPCHYRKSVNVVLSDLLSDTSRIRGSDPHTSKEANDAAKEKLTSECHVYDYRDALRKGVGIEDVLEEMKRYASHGILRRRRV